MTGADLNGLWSAWLRDRAQIHKAGCLQSAITRALAEAVAAAARRSPPGRVEAWEDSRGRGSFAGMHRGADGTLKPDRDPFAKPPPCAMLADTLCLPGCEFGLGPTPCARTGMAEARGEPLPALPAGGVTVATVPANKALRKACNPERSW